METVSRTEFGLVPWVYNDPQNVDPFWFEKVDGNELRIWSKRNLPLFGTICGVYFLFIWLGPRWMKSRNAFKLDKPLAIWNIFLSLFSLTVVLRVTPEIIQILAQPDGYYKSFCDLGQTNYSTTFWVFLFCASKILELGDTVFIVLRKKPLIFLHWFHHFNMVWSTFFMYIEGEPMYRWIVIGNSFVHTIMYAYFGLRAMQIKMPLRVSMMITSIQITQFLYGIFAQYNMAYNYIGQGLPCFRTHNSHIICTVFLFCYLFLFVKLFYQAYIVNPKLNTA